MRLFLRIGSLNRQDLVRDLICTGVKFRTTHWSLVFLMLIAIKDYEDL